MGRTGGWMMCADSHLDLFNSAAVASAFAAEGNGSFWSQPRGNMNGSYSDKESLALAGFDTGTGEAHNLRYKFLLRHRPIWLRVCGAVAAIQSTIAHHLHTCLFACWTSLMSSCC
jgi:hypothetical protein